MIKDTEIPSGCVVLVIIAFWVVVAIVVWYFVAKYW